MKIIVFFLLFCICLTPAALAVDTDALDAALPEAAEAILGEIEWSDAAKTDGLLTKLWTWVQGQLAGFLREAAASAVTALAVALLCSLAASLTGDGRAPDYILLGGALAMCACCAGSITGYLAEAREALCGMSDFSKALLPCVAAASAASGHAVSGAARYAASSLFMDVLLTLGTGVILPLIYAYVAAAVAKAALPGGALGGPAGVIKWLCTTALTVLCTVFTLYITLSGALAGPTDALAGSLAKTAISASLPVVGKIVADAASSYLAGAELLRGAIGVAGLAAVLCVCVGPMLGLGAHYLFFKAAASLTEPFAEGRLAALLSDIGTAYGMALGLVGSGGAILFVSVVLSTEALSA